MVVTTYSGIVPISGSLFETTTTGVFPIVSFDIIDSVDSIDREGNFRTEITVISPDIFFAGGIGQPVIFDITNTVDQIEREGNFRTEITFINSRFDFAFAPLMTATGITVIDFGFNTVGGYVAIPRTNRRIFPTSVEEATLFPGDKPRGSPLN